MNLAHTYYRLFRLMVCPTRFLLGLMIFSVTTMLLTAFTLWLGGPRWVEGFYMVTAMLFAMMFLALQPQIALLASRKTITLCGNTGLYISVLATLLLVFMALILAPPMAHPFDDPAGYWRAVLLWTGVLFLMMAISMLSRFNLFFVGFFLMAMSGFDPVFQAFSFWVQYNSLSLYLFFLAGVLAWWLLVNRLHHGRLKQPLLMGGVQSARSDKEWVAQSGLFNIIPRLRIEDNMPRNWSLLVLESGYYMRDYLLLFTAILVPLCGMFYLIKIYTGTFQHTSLLTAFSVILLFVPAVLAVGGVGNLAANMRRLWLLMPGGRRSHLAFLERQLGKLFLLVIATGWLPAAVLLIADDQPLWWVVTCLVLFVAVVLVMIYLFLLTLIMETAWVSLLRFCYGFLLIGLVILGWFWREPQMPGLVAAALLVLCAVLRPLLYRHWQELDMSRLKLLEMNPWTSR